MLKKLLAVSIVAILAAVMSGCAAVFAVGATAVSESSANDLTGIVEIGEVRAKSGASLTFVKTAKILSVVFEKDMTTPNASPDQNNTKVNAVVTEEAKRFLSLAENYSSSPVEFRLKTFYTDEINAWGWSYYYYGNVTERDTLNFNQRLGVRKLINTHLTLEQGGNTLLEVHGLWGGNDKADEIAGAKQLAGEMASDVLKKLSAASAPPRESVAKAEPKKE